MSRKAWAITKNTSTDTDIDLGPLANRLAGILKQISLPSMVKMALECVKPCFIAINNYDGEHMVTLSVEMTSPRGEGISIKFDLIDFDQLKVVVYEFMKTKSGKTFWATLRYTMTLARLKDKEFERWKWDIAALTKDNISLSQRLEEK